MSGMRGGGGRSRVSSGDAELQRKLNAEAPKVEKLLSRVWELFGPYRKQILFTMSLVVVSSALSVFPPLLTQRAFDDGLFPASGSPNFSALAWILSLMVGIMLTSGAIGIGQTYLTASVGNRVMGDLRIKMFRHLQAMELSFFTRTKTGIIQSRLQNDVGGVSNVLTNTISSTLGNTVTVIAALVSMIVLSWQLTLIAVVATPILVVVQRRVGQLRAKIATKTQESLSDMTAITQESLSVSGILLTKVFNQQDAEVGRYADENKNLVGLQVRLQMSGQWFFAVVQVLLAAIPAGIYLVSAYLLTGGIELTPGTIVAFTTVQARLMMPLMGLMRVALDLQTSQALFARIFEYLDLKPAIVDSPDADTLPDFAPDAGKVVFDRVEFHYPDAVPGAAPVIQDISFVAEPGEFVAIVGPSGSGKTTIAYLAARLYDASSGVVSVSGHDVKSISQASLRSQLGVVTQETYLFHATIAENLRYAKPDATQEELERACRAANIHDTIDSFDQKYDTVVGERGYRLSGGEKQRIAIARVMLKDPRLLILDEATSALDTVSERVVQDALDQVAKGRTTIAIAHRLSTIVAADKILVVDKSHLVEQGTHDELIARNGVYAKLFALQS
ncbi:MAG: ABC transporter ATP-binding protein, partial [Microbacteriaceae bacterium]